MKRLLFALMVIIAGISLFIVPCCALETGFTTSEIEQTKIQEIYQRIDVRLEKERQFSNGFSCFDVKPDGTYALGFDLGNRDWILVYHADNTFAYGISFNCDGSFGLEWDADNLILYTIRGGRAISIDKNGNCVDMRSIENTSENNSYWNHQVWARKRTINDTIYTAEYNMGILSILSTSGYSVLAKEASNGERIFLFDNTERHMQKTIFGAGVTAVFVSVVVICVVKSLVQSIRKDEEEKSHG